MIYSVTLPTVFIVSFLVVLSSVVLSSVHAIVLKPTQSQLQSPPISSSLLNITNQKQFDEWQNESDHAEASGDYVAETNVTDKMALTDCELVLSRNGTLDFAAVYSKLISSNSTAHFPSSGLEICDTLFSGWHEKPDAIIKPMLPTVEAYLKVRGHAIH